MAGKPTRIEQPAGYLRRKRQASSLEAEPTRANIPMTGTGQHGSAHPLLGPSTLQRMQQTIGNRAVSRLLSPAVAQRLVIQRAIKIGEETKSAAWIVVNKFKNTDAAYDILMVINAAQESFADYDKLTERVNELTNLTKVYLYLTRHKAPIAENTTGSPYNDKDEDGVNAYSREYKFTGVDNLLVHVHWVKKGVKHYDIGKAHFKSLSNKFETGKSSNITVEELKAINLPVKGKERIWG